MFVRHAVDPRACLFRLFANCSSAASRGTTICRHLRRPRDIHQLGVRYGRSLRVSTVCIYGGAPYPIQNRELARGADIIVFASPSAVESFLHQAASLRPDAGARQPKAIAIGATTADALRKAGIPLAGTASAPTAKAIRDAVVAALA